MRMVFTSPRLENVEAVAKLLTEAGIEVKVANDRSYKGARRKVFSYRDKPDAEGNPQVWVLKAEDQPRARAMLREQGLLETTRHGVGFGGDTAPPSFLPLSAQQPAARQRDARATFTMRIRLILLAVIAALTVLTMTGVLHR
ncbi:MAG: hypothetical protein JSR34_03255 [Proteobacteria bacterium]|nr:hypothetical protein [Pseudomonadota bacterium]